MAQRQQKTTELHITLNPRYLPPSEAIADDVEQRFSQVVNKLCSRETIPNNLLFVKEDAGFDGISKIRTKVYVSRRKPKADETLGRPYGRVTIQVKHGVPLDYRRMNRSIADFIKSEVPEFEQLSVWVRAGRPRFF